MIVYVITNLVNGKQYVGQTNNKNSKYYLGGGLLIQKAIKKYGKENFRREIFTECFSQEELDKQEMFWIKILNTLKPNGYNIANGGNGVGQHSEESKRKMSEAWTGENNHFYGKKHTKEAKRRISLAHIGIKLSEECRQKLSDINLGKKHTEESKRKMSEARIGIKHTEETKRKISIAVSGINNPMHGKHHTEEAKERISRARIGKRFSAEHKQKLSKAHIGKKRRGKNDETYKKGNERGSSSWNPETCHSRDRSRDEKNRF